MKRPDIKRNNYRFIFFMMPLLAGLSLNAGPVPLSNPGTEDIVAYEKYGKFQDMGTKKYKYVILKRDDLARALGEGIYPNTTVFKDPEYIKLSKEGSLKGTHWNFVDNTNHRINFYKWAVTSEDPGVKQYYIGLMFERMGMLKEAIKAYYNVVVQFPKSTSFTYWDSPFYLGPLCIDKIEILLRRNPQLGLKLVGAKITVENGFDPIPLNDKFIVNPGKLEKCTPDQVKEKRVKLQESDIVRSIGGKEVRLVKYKNGHWQFLVEGKPYIIKAVAYSPNKVGLSPDRGTVDPARDWQNQDFNKNGKIDGPYDSWVDANCNNKQETNEHVVGDARLMSDMGCNTIRIYSHIVNKQLFRDLFKQYKFRLMIGDLVGGYATESGATWAEGTDYENTNQQKRMMENVRKMVLDNKDEPYTLMWVLGNENIFGVGNNSPKKPEAFYRFINKVARMVHELDPNHPVAICNGELTYLDLIAKYAPDLDIIGVNAYRGVFGFGRSFFENVKDVTGKPVLVTEYGCSAYAEGFTEEKILDFQNEYHRNNWEDISFHSAGSGSGNALGGVVFEFVDEWWKANSDMPKKVQMQKKEWYASKSAIYKNLQPENQDKVPQFGAPFLDGWSYEEWLGLFSQGNGSQSPYLRQKRPVYDMYKIIWNQPEP